MDSEKHRSIGNLVTRIACTLFGLLLLCLLGTGPVQYVAYRYPNYYPPLIEPWDGFRTAIRGTPLHQPLEDYWEWWGQLGLNHKNNAILHSTPDGP